MKCGFSPITMLVIGALLVPYQALGADGTVTLRQAVERALSGNHLVRAASLQQGAAQEGVSVSRSRYLPRVVLESGAALSNTPSSVFMMKLDEARINPSSDFAPGALNHPSPRADFKTALILEQPLLDFSVARAVDLARNEAEASDVALQGERESIAFRVYGAYLEVRRAKAYQKVAEQGVADANEHRRLATVRRENGYGLKSDELRAATESAEAEQRLIGARNDLTVARLRLNLLVGGKEGEGLDIESEPKLSPPTLPKDELIRVALNNRPDLKAGQKAVDRGTVALTLARQSYLPTVYAGASYQVNDRDIPLGHDNDSWNVGVNLRWELFDGTRRSHETSKARFTRDAAAASLEDRRREASLQVTESILRSEEHALRLNAAQAALTDATEGMRLVGKRFENGLSAMVELMDAEATLNRARGNLVETENEYLRAVANIYYLSGIFLKEVMR